MKKISKGKIGTFVKNNWKSAAIGLGIAGIGIGVKTLLTDSNSSTYAQYGDVDSDGSDYDVPDVPVFTDCSDGLEL